MNDYIGAKKDFENSRLDSESKIGNVLGKYVIMGQGYGKAKCCFYKGNDEPGGYIWTYFLGYAMPFDTAEEARAVMKARCHRKVSSKVIFVTGDKKFREVS